MKTKATFSVFAAVSLLLSNAAFSAGGKTYQVTGTVVEATPTKIVVQKGTERMEFDLGPETKGSGELKAGEKVTITYTMSATKVEGRPHGSEARPAKIGAQKKEAPPAAAAAEDSAPGG